MEKSVISIDEFQSVLLEPASVIDDDQSSVNSPTNNNKDNKLKNNINLK